MPKTRLLSVEQIVIFSNNMMCYYDYSILKTLQQTVVFQDTCDFLVTTVT